ncbi:hypothetical protein C3F35_02445 [Leclercia sp. LSNIH3]|nr:hypothetical protein C3F35_02445 [Leclercia sp. LSNIH3]POW70338.1 hypothetical protein C3373_13870 [Leclercia sp. LSNIH4]
MCAEYLLKQGIIFRYLKVAEALADAITRQRIALLPRLTMHLQAGQLSGVDFEHFSECGMIAPSFF